MAVNLVIGGADESAVKPVASVGRTPLLRVGMPLREVDRRAERIVQPAPVVRKAADRGLVQVGLGKIALRVPPLGLPSGPQEPSDVVLVEVQEIFIHNLEAGFVAAIGLIPRYRR